MTDDLMEQIRQELERLNPVVSELLSLTSRWNGTVELVESNPLNPYRGKKRFSCGIEIALITAQSETRWRTLIHELIHAHSIGLTVDGMSRYRGWEEGTVENLQRLLRRSVLQQINVSVEPVVFVAEEIEFDLHAHVDAVEDLRRELAYEKVIDRDAIRFFRQLLMTPLAERAAYVLRLGMSIPTQRRAAFVQRYSTLNARLCRAT